VLVLGRPGVTPPGVAPPPIEPPQAQALAGAPAPKGHLPQEPPLDHPPCHQ
jgi:hypothetical protein